MGSMEIWILIPGLLLAILGQCLCFLGFSSESLTSCDGQHPLLQHAQTLEGVPPAPPPHLPGFSIPLPG